MAKAIQSFRAGRRRGTGPRDRAGARLARQRRSQDLVARTASAMTACTPDQVAILAAASFEDMPPLPMAVPGAPGQLLELRWSISTTSSMRERPATVLGSAVSRPGVSVRSTRSSARTRWATRAASRSLSPKRISSSATASFSFTTGTTPECEQVAEGLPGVQVLLAVRRSRAGPGGPGRPEDHGGQAVLPGTHQPVLTDGRDGLEHRGVRRAAALGAGQGRPPGGDGAGGHDDHLDVPQRVQSGDLGRHRRPISPTSAWPVGGGHR